METKKDPKNLNRDRLIFSKGHASAIYYAALAESGFFDVKKFMVIGLLEIFFKKTLPNSLFLEAFTLPPSFLDSI